MPLCNAYAARGQASVAAQLRTVPEVTGSGSLAAPFDGLLRHNTSVLVSAPKTPRTGSANNIMDA